MAHVAAVSGSNANALGTIVTVRAAVEADGPGLARLSTQLGYPASPEELPERLARLQRSGHVVLVADRDGDTVGWIQVGSTPVLVEAPSARILGLVIADGRRGTGIGRSLVAAAEVWAREQGFSRLGVTSNVIRDAAHGFYEHLGFIRKKTQFLFTKAL